MTYLFHPEALSDVEHTTADYSEIDSQPGVEFRLEIERLLKLIISNPFPYWKRAHNFRRPNLRRFPYYLAYIENGENVLVHAIIHQPRS